MLLSAPHRRLLCRPSLRCDEGFDSSDQTPSPRNSLGSNSAKSPLLARFRWVGWAAVGAALLGFAIPAQAYLGGDVTSVESDRAQMKANIQVTQHESYQVHEIQASAGTVVDEYVTAGGKVFAVSWHGQFPPSMQQILGTYFQQYTAALQEQPKTYGRRPLNIQQEGLVVQTGGHMRAYFGRAYIPDMIPTGVTLDQIH